MRLSGSLKQFVVWRRLQCGLLSLLVMLTLVLSLFVVMLLVFLVVGVVLDVVGAGGTVVIDAVLLLSCGGAEIVVVGCGVWCVCGAHVGVKLP